MEEQIPASNFPPVQQGITPEQLEQLKARAREAAIIQTYQQQQPPNPSTSFSPWSPKATSCVRQAPTDCCRNWPDASTVLWHCVWYSTRY
jgi:hypothetical protein